MSLINGMACSNCNCRKGAKSTPGYTYLTNNVPQSVATNQIVVPGSIMSYSCGNNISVSRNTLIVNNCGTYSISVQIIGEAAAAPANTPAVAAVLPSNTVIPTINVNGVARSSVVLAAATNTLYQYEVRAIVYLKSCDEITITNTGDTELELIDVQNIPGSYNVNIIIERFN